MGSELRTLREQLALSQEALARELGVSVRTVSRWESGASEPSPLARRRVVELTRQVPEKRSRQEGDQ